MAQSMQHPTFTMPAEQIEEIGSLGENNSREVRQGMRAWVAIHRALNEAGVDPHGEGAVTFVERAVRCHLDGECDHGGES